VDDPSPRRSALPSYPMMREDPFQPPPGLERLAAGGSVHRVELWDGSTAWLVTGFTEAWSALTSRSLSSDPRLPGFPQVARSYAAFRTDRELGFAQQGPPDHSRLRRTVTGLFSPSRVADLEPFIARTVDDFLDRMVDSGSPADLLTQFAAPVPVMVLARMLGVPTEDEPFFQAATTVRFSRTSTPADLEQATAELHQYMARLSSSDSNNLLSRLVADEGLSRAEAAAMGTLLLLTGHRTTTNMITLGVFTILTEDRLRRGVLADGVDTHLIDELLRFHTIGDAGLPRVATRAIEIGGRPIPAGDAVIISLVAANRDPKQFEHADDFDIDRTTPRHLGFGAGIHHCLGAALARTEIRIALTRTFQRLPDLALATNGNQPEVQNEMSLHGLHSLPVTW
jgi:cytochrome P450